MTIELSMKQNFKIAVRGLIALHRLDREGRDESREAELIRDSLDKPQRLFDQIERVRFQWLSEDLYSISDPPAYDAVKSMDMAAQQMYEEALVAKQDRDWDSALVKIRELKPHFTPARLSNMRGSIWLGAGFPDVAAEFFGHACDCDPANANYRAILMYALGKSDPYAAGVLAAKVLADEEKRTPAVLARAAS